MQLYIHSRFGLSGILAGARNCWRINLQVGIERPCYLSESKISLSICAFLLDSCVLVYRMSESAANWVRSIRRIVGRLPCVLARRLGGPYELDGVTHSVRPTSTITR